MVLESYRALVWVVVILLSAFAGFAFGGPAPIGLAQQTPFTPPAAQAAPSGAMIEPLALQILKRMSDSLRRATSFTFTATTMRDEVAITGQSLEFYRRLPPRLPTALGQTPEKT